MLNEHLKQAMVERTPELESAYEAQPPESERRARSDEAWKEVLRQLVTAEENERRRISRELYDQLGQQITAVALRLAILKTTQGAPAAMLAHVADIEKLLGDIDAAVDTLVRGLRPPVLDDFGLAHALSEYIGHWTQQYQVKVQFRARCTNSQRLDLHVETVLYRVVQEALMNVAKHAQASDVDVVLEHRAGEVCLTVSDNGRGFEPMRAQATEGAGLVGMRERVSLIGATLHIDSSPGNGTRLLVRMPAR